MSHFHQHGTNGFYLVIILIIIVVAFFPGFFGHRR